jgi:hypothetical protein
MDSMPLDAVTPPFPPHQSRNSLTACLGRIISRNISPLELELGVRERFAGLNPGCTEIEAFKLLSPLLDRASLPGLLVLGTLSHRFPIPQVC